VNSPDVFFGNRPLRVQIMFQGSPASRHRRSFAALRVLPAILAVSFVAGSPARVEAHPPLAESERVLEVALDESPENAGLHLQQAILHRRRSNWEDAAASYRRAAALGADEHGVDVALAQVYLGAGRLQEASARIEHGLEHRPDDAGALITRARIQKALGNVYAAAFDYQSGVALLEHPDPSVVREAMAAQVAAGRSEAALEIADTATLKIGIIVSIALPAIEVERELGRSDAALERIDALLRQAPEQVLWLAERGAILESAGRLDEARTEYERTVSLLDERSKGRQSRKLAQLRRRLMAKLSNEKLEEDGNS